MIPPGSPLSPEVDPLLDCERSIPSCPPAVKARAVARARALMVAGGSTLASKPVPRSRARWFVAAAAACGVSAAFGAAAYEIRARLDARPTLAAITATAVGPSTRSSASRRTRAMHGSPATSRAVGIETADETTTAPGVDAEAGPITAATAETTTATTPTASSTRAQQRDTARGELRLLREARDDVARGDYAAALAPITRHARRYGYVDGRLVEEREALRVKALAGLGRTDDAQRAASAFQTRFPQSVLSPAIGHLIVAAP